MKKFAFTLVFVLMIFLTACGNKGYKNVTAEDAKQLIGNNKLIVLDVRTQEEYQQGHIPNATLIPLQELEGRLNELKTDAAYLVVCRSGKRSAQASEILTDNGFIKVYNMTGGMNNWRYEIEK
ncbi:rhodanese-like domain-containing protein [Neobacillus kokaensis]|uniref:Sulfurtransferase n=1 Tax=Neobacillus kokaensis TaxID=2759023 RepID=A0ABQ3N371_9BACI|nr:rhodanese-like domain-containing protein [Neobacillus kokaensis]GHH99137.1 sulfurtransferase [Neobacillus kokaensis]